VSEETEGPGSETSFFESDTDFGESLEGVEAFPVEILAVEALTVDFEYEEALGVGGGGYFTREIWF